MSGLVDLAAVVVALSGLEEKPHHLAEHPELHPTGGNSKIYGGYQKNRHKHIIGKNTAHRIDNIL